MTVRHIFWDLGGTLVDSYPSIRRAFLGVLQEHGKSMSEPELQRLLNLSTSTAIEALALKFGIESAEFTRAYEALKDRWALHPAPVMPGAMSVMNEVRRLRGLNLVVTNRDQVSAKMLIRVTKLDVNDLICASYDMPRKPNPTMHRTLLERHGLDPAECVGVGDRAIDTEAALAVGMHAVQLQVPGGRIPVGVQAIGSLIELMPLLHPDD